MSGRKRNGGAEGGVEDGEGWVNRGREGWQDREKNVLMITSGQREREGGRGDTKDGGTVGMSGMGLTAMWCVPTRQITSRKAEIDLWKERIDGVRC